MRPDATVTSFAIVFSLFVVVTLVLIVLVIRFTGRRAAASRARWLAAQEGAEEEEPEPELTALVLAGGGPRGAVQVGMLQVLADHGFVPDRIYGSSVGAINGVGFASDPTSAGVERMAQIWLGLGREDIYPQGRLHGPWLYLQQRDSVYASSGLRKIMEEGFAFDRLEETAVPVEVVATSLSDGREHWFTYGPAIDAVLASMAIPAIFPPVEIGDERFIDGGVVNNVPIRRAIDAGATKIVVLLCAPPVFTPIQPKRPVEAMVNALMISVHARFARDMAQLPPGVEVILCVGNEGVSRDFDDFSTTESLIAQGREEASEVVRRYGLGRNGIGGSGAPVHDAASVRAATAADAGGGAGDDTADRAGDGTADRAGDSTVDRARDRASDGASDGAAESTAGPPAGDPRPVDAEDVAHSWTQPEPGT
jgi:NTE family protein